MEAAAVAGTQAGCMSSLSLCEVGRAEGAGANDRSAVDV